MFTGGCANMEMKGTPFFTGGHGKHRGPAEQRVNGWPLVYYRDPALSVLWPVFELTDDHAAVRPVFSVYGLDRANREYNVLWPLAQFDFHTRDHHVFPVFWGDDHRVAFPLYWHFDSGMNRGWTDSLFPLWVVRKRGTNELSVWAAWPSLHRHTNTRTGRESSMVFPFYYYRRAPDGSLFLSLPWMSGRGPGDEKWSALFPLFYQSSDSNHSALVTLLWAQGKSERRDWIAVVPLAWWDQKQETWLSPLWAQWRNGDRRHHVAPWALSWSTIGPDRSDLWLLGGLAHSSWGEKPGAHHAFPFYYRNPRTDTLLTPLCGWSESAEFLYPFTPLAGIRTKSHSGSWLFPLYSLSRNERNGDVMNQFLLTAGYSKTGQRKSTFCYPLFSFHDFGPLESSSAPGIHYGHYGKSFWCLPWCWSENVSTVRAVGRGEKPDAANGLVREYTRGNGAVPLWDWSHRTVPAAGTTNEEFSVLGWLYDYKHDIGPARGGSAPNDYTRTRVLWRLWHYELLNGDVSVDVFPGITYDHKKNGYQKTAFLWRVFRNERAANGNEKTDVLFVPVRR